MLDSDPAAVPELQTELMSLCAQAGLDDLGAFQFTCAVVEAVNNCIEHAYGDEPGHAITLGWQRDRDGVRIEIRDQGRPRSSTPSRASVAMDPSAESGRGCHIIDAWTDTATYCRDGNENVLTITRRL